MAYYLTIRKNKEYSKLDISSLQEFKKESKFKDKNSYSLQEIDYFTSCFNNEIALKKILLSHGIISEEDIIKEIEIRYKNNNELVKVRYDLVYKEAAKYFDINFLRYFLLSKSKDYIFLNRLLSFYRNSYCNNENICRIRYILNTNSEHEFTMNETLSNFLISEVYNNNYRTGSCTLKYKSLHDLAMFCYNYELNEIRKELSLSNEEIEQNRIRSLNGLKKNKPKKLLRKRKEIDGQLSFDDLI